MTDGAGTLHVLSTLAISLVLQLQGGAAPGGRFDLVMANILRGPLLELQPRLTGYCRPGGRLVLSGILQEQVCVVVVGLLAVSRARACACRLQTLQTDV